MPLTFEGEKKFPSKWQFSTLVFISDGGKKSLVLPPATPICGKSGGRWWREMYLSVHQKILRFEDFPAALYSWEDFSEKNMQEKRKWEISEIA